MEFYNNVSKPKLFVPFSRLIPPPTPLLQLPKMFFSAAFSSQGKHILCLRMVSQKPWCLRLFSLSTSTSSAYLDAIALGCVLKLASSKHLCWYLTHHSCGHLQSDHGNELLVFSVSTSYKFGTTQPPPEEFLWKVNHFFSSLFLALSVMLLHLPLIVVFFTMTSGSYRFMPFPRTPFPLHSLSWQVFSESCGWASPGLKYSEAP